MRCRVLLEKKFSPALSQDAEVGVARMARQPGQHFRMFVGGIVVEDDVDRLVGNNPALDSVEKADEFDMAVALHAAAVDGAVEHAECREQGGGAVPLVVMRQ